MAVTENVFLPIGDPGGPSSGQTDFTFTFEYLNKDTDIKVSLDGVDTSEYTFATDSVVRFNTAPADGVIVRIYRDTDIDTARAVFAPGSVIRAQDLNDNFEQIRFVVQEVDNNTWDNETETINSTETWVSSDNYIATTGAIDGRISDRILTSGESWTPGDDTGVSPSAVDARIDSKIDTALTNDIAGSDGVTITDDGDGTITVGLGANSIDFDRIKDVDIITTAEQNAGTPTWGDTYLATAGAASRRFDTLVQAATPTGSNWVTGKTWLQTTGDLTLSIWNGTNWVGIASGGTFTNQPKVVYVDTSSGDDSNDGHRISRPKKTIKAAVEQINADATYGDGSVVVVAPGVYQEVAPIQIQRPNISIIGQALRSCVVHPTSATETNTLFELNSGSYVSNLTLTGMKANGALGNTVDAALPVNQGWNFGFYSGATITKSPYIQNCTNFSDSEIDNDNINVITPGGGSAGDTDSAPTGGGLLVDGSVVDSASPLRSMVCDSYTHVGLNGPGILVTNNGYAQCTSSYAFFNKYHIKCLNGGQANLAASTTDFGDEALVADGKSTSPIFTADLSGSIGDGEITFTIDEPVADASWHGSATRPQGNMLVELNSIIYPVLSATANGSGWDVTISRPNPSKRSENLGLDGAVTTPAVATFYLRSMIASSGHTMEYVGSGTDYRALPENGGVPDDSKQIVELNGGKVWTAITDQNGKFKIGDFFEVDQRTGFINFSAGSYAFDVVTDTTPELGGQLDALTNKIVNLGDPTSAQDAVTKAYVDGLSFASYSDAIANFTGTLQQGGSDVVLDSDIGVTVQGYDANLPAGNTILVDGDIGVTVEAYDATILKSADIGSTVQGYDADTVKTDVLPTFTVATRSTERTITAGAFDLSTGNLWTVGAITVPNPTNAAAGQTGAIRITAGPVVWSSNFKFPGGTAPTIATFPAIIPYYVQDSSTILMGNVVEGIA